MPGRCEAICLIALLAALSNAQWILEKGEKNLMQRKISLLVFVLAFVGCASSAYAQNKRGPSTPEERKRAVEMATFLDKNPLAKEAKDQRASLLFFLADAP